MNIPLDKWSGADATRELQADLRKYNETSSRQTKQMIILTWVIAVLTGLMFVGLCVQIWLAR
jgi:hypothetical protein